MRKDPLLRGTARASARKSSQLTICEALPGIWPPPRCPGCILIHFIPAEVEGKLGPQKAHTLAAEPCDWQAGKLMQLDTNSGGKDSNPALFPPVTPATVNLTTVVNPNHPMIWKTV